MTRIRVAVIGAGHLGRIHARLLSELPEVEVVAVVDPSQEARELVSRDLRLTCFADISLVGKPFDAAVLATPTSSHHALGKELLARGVHLFVEKPLAPSSRQARDLADLAQSQGRVLQVGHVERFNPALAAIRSKVQSPHYIEAHRCSGYSFRSTDIGVVLDLMIHDIDLALSLVPSRVARIEAYGRPVIGPSEDIAQARLVFENGSAAHLTASRVNPTNARTLQIWDEGNLVHVDLANRSAVCLRAGEKLHQGNLDLSALSPRQRDDLRQAFFTDILVKEEIVSAEANPLQEELREFIRCIHTGQRPMVSGEEGATAVEVAERVLEQIARQQDLVEKGVIPLLPVPHRQTRHNVTQPWRHRREAG